MDRLARIRANRRFRYLFEGQVQHILMATLMLLGLFWLLEPPFRAEPLYGLTTTGWAFTSAALAIVHQVVVAFVFRTELHLNLMTRIFGRRDMHVWAAIFMPLLIARPLTVIMTGWADGIPITEYRWTEITLGCLLLAPALWGMHSTIVHFTLPRALGGDHFREDYATMPLVNKGIFRYTRNGMYGVVFLGLWGIALLFGSWNALALALFQHSYIWVHMYCTEAPDMRFIYG